MFGKRRVLRRMDEDKPVRPDYPSALATSPTVAGIQQALINSKIREEMMSSYQEKLNAWKNKYSKYL